MKRLLLTFSLCFSILFLSAQWQDPDSNLLLSSLESSDIQTAGANNGGTYIAYYAPFEGNYYIRVQYLNAAGEKQFGDSGIVLIKKKSGSATFVFNVCVDNFNNLFVATQYQKGGSMVIVVNKISPKGRLIYGEYGYDLGEGLAPYPVTLTNGNTAVAWVNNNTINYQILMGDSTAMWETPKVFGPGTRAQLVAHTNNTFGMVYQKLAFPPFYTNLYEQRFDENGDAMWAAPVKLSDVVTASYRYYSVISDRDQTYVGYYGNPSGSNRFDGYVQRVNGDGSIPWGLNGSKFATYEGNDPYTMGVSVAKSKKSDIIWSLATMSDFLQNEYGVSVQKMDASTGQRQLGDHGKEVFAIGGESPRTQDELQLCNDNPIFIYTDNSNQLFATGLDQDGNFSWDPASTVLSSNTNEKGRFGFTAPVKGQAVAVWSDSRTGTSQPYAQNIGCDGKTGGEVLPVTLLNFKGYLAGNVVNLSWETAIETNNKGFYIERSSNGINFTEIGFVASKASNGNSNLRLNYSHVDNKPLNGDNFYRLKQEDKDGRNSYSSVIMVSVKTVFESRIKPIYPNPVTGTLNLYVESKSSDKMNISIVDANGRIVKQLSQNIQEGNNNYQINVSSLPAGTYFISINGLNKYENAKQHFVKQ